MTNEDLIKEIRNGKESAKEELIMGNMALVHYFIRKYFKIIPYELTVEDLEQAGIIGLMKAVKYFDFSYRVKFITFAYRYVRGEILKTMESCNTKTRPFSSYISSKEDKDAYVSEDIVDYINYTLNSEKVDDFENRITDRIFAGEILNMLTKKQQDILKYRYKENLTQQEIGRRMGIHQVDVSREESKAKRKIVYIMEHRNCSI